MIIVNERQKALIIYQDGKMISKINDEYNRLKYNKYDGNRIFYKWNDDNEISETYDDRIFNANHKDKTLQIHGGHANDIASAIQSHDVELFEKLFKECYYVFHKTQIIEGIINNTFNRFGKRVRQTRNRQFIIDERFMVDEHGVAHTGNDSKKKNKWKFLCIVAKRLGKKIVKHDGIEITLDTKMVEIMAKVNFLYNAEYHTNDSVFMNQLPSKISSQVKREAEILASKKSQKDIFEKRNEEVV